MTMEPPLPTEPFESRLVRAARLACHEWDLPTADLESWVLGPLTPDLLAGLDRGFHEGSLIIVGTTFRLRDLPPKKGPYTLFTRHADRRTLTPNVEYFVEVAEFLRLIRSLGPLGFSIGFEDKLMDITVRLDGALAWFIEAKETSAKVQALLDEMALYGAAVPLTLADRGIDGLRKAKYLIEHRPAYFSTVAVGRRDDFRVDYVSATSFRLARLATEPDAEELRAAAIEWQGGATLGLR